MSFYVFTEHISRHLCIDVLERFFSPNEEREKTKNPFCNPIYININPNFNEMGVSKLTYLRKKILIIFFFFWYNTYIIYMSIYILKFWRKNKNWPQSGSAITKSSGGILGKLFIYFFLAMQIWRMSTSPINQLLWPKMFTRTLSLSLSLYGELVC